MIYLLKEKAVSTQIQGMLEEYEDMIKIVVDIRRQYLSGAAKCMQIANRSCSKMGVNKTIFEEQIGIRVNNELSSNH